MSCCRVRGIANLLLLPVCGMAAVWVTITCQIIGRKRRPQSHHQQDCLPEFGYAEEIRA